MADQKRWGHRERPFELILIPIILAMLPPINYIGWYFQYIIAGQPKTLLETFTLNMGTFSNGPLGTLNFIMVLILWIGFLVTAFGIYQAKKWSFFSYISLASINFLASFFNYSFTNSQGGYLENIQFDFFRGSVLVNLLFFIPVFFILRKDIMAPFFNPEIKWWEQHKRVKKNLQVMVPGKKDGKESELKTYDISASGLFIQSDDLDQYQLQQEFIAHIGLKEIEKTLEVLCRVVWVSEGDGNYPRGFGCTFIKLDRENFNTLKTYLRHLIKEGESLHER